MISIPVSPASHQRLSTASKWLCAIGYVLLALLFSLSGLSSYRKANAILKDHAVVSAPVELESIEEKSGRKGRVSYEYHFNYAFEVDGVPYRDTFSTSESNASRYQDDGATVEIAYSRTDPSNFERLTLLENNKDLGAVVRRLLLAMAFAAVLAFFAHLLITRKLFVARQEVPAPAQ